MTKNPSTDLTKPIIIENKLQVLRVEIENISGEISPSHGDQTSRLPTRDISVRELPSSNDPSPISSAQHHSTNNPDCAILFDSIIISESIVLKNKPRSKLLINRIESSFSKSNLPPPKKPKPTIVPQTESLQKNPPKFYPASIHQIPKPTTPIPQTLISPKNQTRKPQKSTFTVPDKSIVNGTDQSCL
jgi:hypothetical protein